MPWQEVPIVRTRLSDREVRAATEAFLRRSPRLWRETEPHLVIHLRNRQAAQPLSMKRQKTQRRILNLHELKSEEPALRFLRSRSTYVGQESSDDDLKAEIALALLQAGILEQDSEVADWFCGEYLFGFLPLRAKAVGRGVTKEICVKVFQGLWKNWGNAEFAQAWRPYVKTWIDKTSSNHLKRVRRSVEVDEPDGNDEDGALTRRREETHGALSPTRKRRRDVAYATTLSDAKNTSERYSVAQVAKVLSLSVRQVYRLLESGRLGLTQRDPAILVPVEVEKLAREYDTKRALSRNRLTTIHHLILQSGGTLNPASARKAEYRSRKRKGATT